LAYLREESHLLVVLQSAFITPNFVTTFVFLFIFCLPLQRASLPGPTGFMPLPDSGE